MQKPILRVAAKAVVVNDKGQVLILREAKTYKDGTNIGHYHMPGGRLESGESYEEGLNREVSEETGLKIKPLFPIFVGEWNPVIKGVPHHIIAIFTVSKAKSSKVKLSDEHDDFKWIEPQEYAKYDIMDPENDVLKRYVEWSKKT